MSTNIPVHTVYLALGSNMGDRLAHLTKALQALVGVVIIEEVSSVYETEPVGYLEQAKFFNIVCRGRTQLSPQELLALAKATEKQIGRVPTFRNGPRVIDIDILLYGTLHIEEEQLVIPHPRMTERAFVMVPLVEIAPHIIHPLIGQSMQELLQPITTTSVIKVRSFPSLNG